MGAMGLLLGCSHAKSAAMVDAQGPEPVENDASGPAPAPDLAPPADSPPAKDSSSVEAAAVAADAPPSPADTAATSMGPGPMVYVGGFRAEIDVFRLDPATAKLTKVGAVAGAPAMPSFFAWHASGRFGYSVDESPDGKVVSYAIDQSTCSFAISCKAH